MAQKQSKNAKRRAKAKEERVKKVEVTPAPEEASPTEAPAVQPPTEPLTNGDSHDSSTQQNGNGNDHDRLFDIDEDDPIYAQFKDMLNKFQEPSQEEALKAKDKEVVYFDDDEIPDEEEEEEQKKKLSKKAKKALNKLSIAELKALVRKPELVEWTDTSAPDPRLLVSMKAYKNVVPVPNHWSLKREYLSSKRGVEKPPFALPKFIAETGITEMRNEALDKQAEMTLKQRQRERVQGKTGKLDIDYVKLHEAFFRKQTKPEMTRYGEIYYEGKEYETNLRHLRPGELSEKLKDALNIPPGAPPPWLINMQRYGPPPSYPALKIPGLNAPPPPGGQWGFHPGGYGKPPVDEYNRPLYGGDVFGLGPPPAPAHTGVPVERNLWGELLPPGEEEKEEEPEDDEDDEDELPMDGMQTQGGLETPAGIASTVPSEFTPSYGAPSEFTLRKERRGTETEEPTTTAPRSAYQVLPEQNIRTTGFFGGERAYDLSAARNNVRVLGQEDNSKKRKAGDIDVSVDVDALEKNDKLDKQELAKKYETESRAAANPWGHVDQEDLSQMIADESRKRLKKDEERRGSKRR